MLFLSVPKRQLARAVDRNLVRRIAREAWRGAGLAQRPIAVLVKLRRRPEWFAAAGLRQKRRQLRVELDALSFVEALIAVGDDVAEVNEEVVALLARDEAVALVCIEELDHALCHDCSFLIRREAAL